MGESRMLGVNTAVAPTVGISPTVCIETHSVGLVAPTAVAVAFDRYSGSRTGGSRTPGQPREPSARARTAKTPRGRGSPPVRTVQDHPTFRQDSGVGRHTSGGRSAAIAAG